MNLKMCSKYLLLCLTIVSYGSSQECGYTLQYTEHDNLNIVIRLKNLPRDLRNYNYSLLSYHSSKYNRETLTTPLNSYIITLNRKLVSEMDNTDIILILIRRSDSTECRRRTIVRLYYNSTLERDDRTVDCLVNLESKCNSSQSPPANNSSSISNKEFKTTRRPQLHDKATTSTSSHSQSSDIGKSSNDPNKETTKGITISEGDDINYSCFQGNHYNSIIYWNQTRIMNKDKELELLRFQSSPGYAFHYTGKVYEFDNNTIMNCYREQMTSESMLSVLKERKKIYVKPGAAYRDIPSVYYHDYYNYNVSCNNSTHWLHINDKNEILQVSKMPGNKTDVQFALHLNKTHHNSKLYCIQLKCSSPAQATVQWCIRNVTAVTKFKEDKELKTTRRPQLHDKTTTSTSSHSQSSDIGKLSNNPNKDHTLLICLVIAVILIVVLLIVIYFLVSKNKSRRQQPLPDDATHYSVVYDHCIRQRR